MATLNNQREKFNNQWKKCLLALVMSGNISGRYWYCFRLLRFLAYWQIGHKLLAWPGVGVVDNNFSSLFFSETTGQNTLKLYIQLPYIGVYKNSSLHVDPIVDVDFIRL